MKEHIQGKKEKNWRTLENIFVRFVQGLYLLLFVWILVLLLFFADRQYACKAPAVIDNGLLLFEAVSCFLLSIGLLGFLFRKRECSFSAKRLFLCFTMVLFIFQIYISYQIYFETGWDSGGKVLPAAFAIASGQTEILADNYYSMYPNNSLLISFFALLVKINNFLGIFGAENRLMPIILVNCLIASITCYLIFSILYRLLNVKYAAIGYFFSVLLVGLSPWITICYSDMIGLFFPVIILYIYLQPVREKWGNFQKYLLIFVLAYLGYQIKPQSAILVIAIVLWELFHFLESLELKRIKQYLFFILMLFLCMEGLHVGLNAVYKKEGFVFQEDRAFGMTHFFMMGLNPDTMGVYSEEDVQASKICETAKERIQKNLEVSSQRLKEYGIGGYLCFLSKKMLTNYNDGTFAWSQEGNFYKQMRKNHSGIARFLRNIYYIDGKYYKYFKLVVQGIWLIILIGCLAAGCFKGKGFQNSRDCQVILMLTIVGITVFELLFEARARYLFIYVPVYIVTAVVGFSKMRDRLWGFWEKCTQR